MKRKRTNYPALRRRRATNRRLLEACVSERIKVDNDDDLLMLSRLIERQRRKLQGKQPGTTKRLSTDETARRDEVLREAKAIEKAHGIEKAIAHVRRNTKTVKGKPPSVSTVEAWLAHTKRQ